MDAGLGVNAMLRNECIHQFHPLIPHNGTGNAGAEVAFQLGLACFVIEAAHTQGLLIGHGIAQGVGRLCPKAGIELLRQMGYEKIVAFGDNYNDLGMFEAADVSVAVGNACDEVKNAADIVIEKNTEDGVAKFLLQCVEKA